MRLSPSATLNQPNRTFYKMYDIIPLIIFGKFGIIEKISDFEAII